MAEAADLSERIRFGASLLETTLKQHRAKQLLSQRACIVGSGRCFRVVFVFGHFLASVCGCSSRVDCVGQTPAACTCSQAW